MSIQSKLFFTHKCSLRGNDHHRQEDQGQFRIGMEHGPTRDQSKDGATRSQTSFGMRDLRTELMMHSECITACEG